MTKVRQINYNGNVISDPRDHLIQRVTPYEYHSYKKLKPHKGNDLVQKVVHTCNTLFKTLYYFICNGVIECANKFKLYRFERHLISLNTARKGQCMNAFLYVLYNSVSPIERYSIQGGINFLQSFYILKSLFLSDNPNLISNKKIIFALSAAPLLSALCMRRSFHLLDIFLTTTATCIVSYRTIQRLKECWKLSKINRLKSLEFAAIHITVLTMSLHKLHQTLFNPLTFENFYNYK